LNVLLSGKEKILSAYARDLFSASEFQINDGPPRQSGQIGKTPSLSKPLLLPIITDFNAGAGKAEVIVRLSNFHIEKGGGSGGRS